MDYDDGFTKLPVITNWHNCKNCYFSEKRWVNPKDVNTEKDYETGDFLRVWCAHDQCWCSAEFGYEFCCIYRDHEDE